MQPWHRSAFGPLIALEAGGIMSAITVVLDTNVLISALAYPDSVPGRIFGAWRLGSIDLILSTHILEELRRVLPRLHHRHGLGALEIDELVDSLALQVDVLEPAVSELEEVRDPQDRPVLGTLIKARESCPDALLVTGDKDLLVLAGRYPICTPTAFWTAHGGL